MSTEKHSRSAVRPRNTRRHGEAATPAGSDRKSTADGVERALGTATALMLAEAGRLLGSSLDVEITLRNVGHIAVGWMADWCIVDLLPGDGTIRRVEVATADPGAAGTAARLRALRLSPAQTWLGSEAARTRRPVLTSPLTDHHLAAIAQGPDHYALLRGIGATACISVPLLLGDELLGCMTFLRTSGPYGRLELRTASELAALAAQAIGNARAYDLARNRLARRDDVLAIVAHDLRSPLSNIVFSASLLKLRLQEGGIAGLDASLDGIFRTADYMTRLIEDLVIVGQAQRELLTLRLGPVPVCRLLEQTAAAFGPAAEAADLRLDVDCRPDVGDAVADENRILQVLANLMGNAIRFTDAGGSVRLHARRANGRMEFEVADSGCGIPALHLEHIFEPFWRTADRPQPGLGLGLAIARTIVERHGGTIQVRSREGRGSTFSFHVPAAG
jgi:signal transduction histidine kinase